MAVRPGWLWLCVVLVGPSLAVYAPAQEPEARARQLWALGQEAMRQGKPAEAVQYYEQSLAADEGQKRAHLSVAAAYVQCGDEVGAARHLAEYLAAFPEHHVVRKHYAELLLRLGQPREARGQFERFIADVQDTPELAAKYLVPCHSRLMEIAKAEGDEYGEHLHRGIGLYLLARERADLPDPEEGDLSVESVLCEAAGELTMARMARRDEARPSWYLFAVWSRLEQRQPALRHLREAESLAPFSDLTPAEKRDLAIACLGRDAELRRPR
ncbi:MAG TPA: tetratricopeptide repeat protein [Gemmataceae bacterium]|nr:tetratricopeptide repeat protein [Gemmataceae bacterium]